MALTEDEMQAQYDLLCDAIKETRVMALPYSHRRVYVKERTGFNVEDHTISGPACEDSQALRAALERRGFTFTTEAVNGWYGSLD